MSKSSPGLFRELLGGLRLLSLHERKLAAGYAAMAVASGFIDTVALASTMPFIALLVDVNGALQHPSLAKIFVFLGAPEPRTFVIEIGSICLSLVVVSGLLSSWLQTRTVWFVARSQARVAEEVLDAIVHAPYAWFLGINTQVVGHVFQRDVLLWARELVAKLLNITRDATLIVLPTVLVMIATPLIGIVTIGLIGALMLLIIRYTRPRITALTKLKQSADARAYSLAGQVLGGIKDVTISGRQGQFVAAFSRAYTAYTETSATIQDHHQMPNKAILLLGQVGLLVVAMVLWAMGSDRGSLAAQLSLLVLVTSRVVPAANRLSSAMTTFFGVLPAVREIEGLFSEIQSAGANRNTAGRPQLLKRPWKQVSFEKVNFSYPGTSGKAIRDISFVLEAGKSYGIVGASGAGKSTIVDLLLGLIAPSAGQILVDEAPLGRSLISSWQSKIGYVPQSPFLIDDSIGANIAFGVPQGERDSARVGHAIETANLAAFIDTLPAGLETNLGDRGVRLSGGQRQRVAIARALYDECDLLVLDEATAALDTVSERAVQDAVLRLKGEITTIAIAHRLSTVRDCDKILVLDGGHLVAEGTWDELLVRSARFREMVQVGSDEVAA